MSEEEETADVSLDQLSEEAEGEGFDAMVSADVLQSVPVTLSVEVGRTRLKIRDLLRLKQGSVIELERNRWRASGSSCEQYSCRAGRSCSGERPLRRKTDSHPAFRRPRRKALSPGNNLWLRS